MKLSLIVGSYILVAILGSAGGIAAGSFVTTQSMERHAIAAMCGTYTDKGQGLQFEWHNMDMRALDEHAVQGGSHGTTH